MVITIGKSTYLSRISSIFLCTIFSLSLSLEETDIFILQKKKTGKKMKTLPPRTERVSEEPMINTTIIF